MNDKKPDIEQFREVLDRMGGNLTKVAEVFGVHRTTVGNWANNDSAFADAVANSRKRMFDDTLSAARIVALGIPDKDEEGNVVGWVERPDGYMLRYLLSKLGKDEGFGDEQKMDVVVSGGKMDLSKLTDEQRKVLLTIGTDLVNKKE